ncbi:sulfotransferase 1B1-like [Saccoglossus kowalevskii]|uniref:Amine sulfotransferase-like 173 n=1 Tax=Saccoglossus kowalevskii TaxID=10224 RepID=A0A0U2T5Z3_SACKO|nr:PREDICTED: sulfotransferase family cytosolic 1B member 1-like [Saccoglossus kowalevskii]ALR88682.1 amine sulfotransferase-like 173 [Saccoglossus kowalevskii]
MEGAPFTVKGYYFLPFLDQSKIENHEVEKFEFRNGDVVVSGFPKSGNTWLVEVLKQMYGDWGLCHVGGASEAIILEEHTVHKWFPGIRQKVVDINVAEDIPSPRLLRTHLPFPFFPMQKALENGVKVIYITRNPKDVCVSHYHFLKGFAQGALQADWEGTLTNFVENRMLSAPWIDHVDSWLGVDKNLMHVKYEDMKRDLPSVVQRIAEFLGRPVRTEDVERTIRSTTIDDMKKRFKELLILDENLWEDGKSPFIRKGVTGDWKNHFTAAQSQVFDEKIGQRVKELSLDVDYQ